MTRAAMPQRPWRPTGPWARIASHAAAHLAARLAACLVLCAAGVAALLPGAAWAQVTLKVGVYQNSPKIDYRDGAQVEGVFADVLLDIAARNGWSVQWVPGTFSEGLTRLSQGSIDIMPDVALTSARQDEYAFHKEPVLSSWNQVYARRGSGIRSVIDLDGRRVAVLEGSMQQDYVAQMGSAFAMNITLLPHPDFATAFQAVVAGRADAVVTNRFYGARHGAASDLEDTAIIFNPSRLYFAARKGIDPAILDTIDRELLAMKSDPASAYQQSITRWALGTSSGAPLPYWARWAVAGVALLLLGAAAWVVTLRRHATRLQASERRQRELADERELLLRELGERARALEFTASQLEQAKEVAETSDRIKSAFLATMSHELRTPLNSIIGFTGIVLQRLAGPLTDEQARQLAMVMDSARHLLALINDVLDISKIEAGELRVDHSPFDLTDSVRKTLGIIAPLAQKKGLRLDVSMPDGPIPMTGDARRVEQILLNLLSNSVKFTEHGSVSLDVQAMPDGPSGPAMRLRVTDTGIGIKDEDMVLMFTPFRQIDSALSRKHEGTGLGLAICERLTRLMGGHIEASSQWGQGSTFTVILPVAASVGPLKPGH